MSYAIDYYAFEKDDHQPGEAFEDDLGAGAPHGRWASSTESRCVWARSCQPRSGAVSSRSAGAIPTFEIRTILGRDLARYLVGLDGSAKPPRMVLLHGLAKRVGQPTPKVDLERAPAYWRDYRRTRRVSLEEEPR